MSDFFSSIFSDFDDKLALTLDRDPLGLQPIWTALGNEVFGGVTTSVATDIRNYTINLIHHAVVYTLKKDGEFWDGLKIAAKHSGEGLESDTAIQNRLILALEMMLAFSALHQDWEGSQGILGISSARNRWSGENGTQNDPTIDLKEQPQDPNKQNNGQFVTLLVRQSGLGINGRYKGPFKSMGLLDKNGVYSALSAIWDEVIIDLSKPENHVYNDLINCLVETLTKSKESEYKISLNSDYVSKYRLAFGNGKTLSKNMEDFWLSKMNISPGSLARSLYDQITPPLDSRALFFANQNHSSARRICEVEPFLTLYEYLFAALLQDTNNKALIEKIENLISDYSIESLPQDSERLKILINIKNIKNDVISYHMNIAKERGIHPWITNNPNRKVFKKISYIKDLEKKVELLKDGAYANISWEKRDYYLSSILQIKSGFAEVAA